MFKRKAYSDLAKWKSISHGQTAALIEGARRIGKSTVAEAFAKAEYDDYMILDFSLEDEDVKQRFKEDIGDPNTFFRNLFLLKGKRLPERRAVIIFDEVQLFPIARQAIKALVADGRYDYIETGSLISLKKNTKDILIPSEEYRIKMHPMDFEEFLWALGDDVTSDVIREAFAELKPLGAANHRKVMKDFRSYMAIGGMPQAVSAFVDGRNFDEIDFIKRSILNLYEEDINKYGQNANWAVSVFKSIPEQLTHHNSHFKLSVIDKNARYPSIAGALDFLCDSMTVDECLNVTAPEVLLDIHVDNSTFKLYMADTGLLVTQAMKSGLYSEDSLYKALVFDKLGTNLGMIMENVVAQMLVANNHQLRFHEFKYTPEKKYRLNDNSDKTESGSGKSSNGSKGPKKTPKEKRYKIDFLLVRDRRVCPVEVKSSGYRAHASLDYFFEKYDVKSRERYVLYTKDLMKKGPLTYLPIYMTMCL